jgi:hypothetical protein
LVIVGAASGCATSTSGQPTGGLIKPTGPTRFPSTTQEATIVPPTIAPPSSFVPPSSVPPSSVPASSDSSANRVITVHGADGSPYEVEMLASDRVTDCAAHSYGGPIIAYFRAHPCKTATRRLFGILIRGRVAVMSTIVVACALGPAHDPYRWTGKLDRLERANGTGSMNDLLREGVRIAGVPSAIPAHEAFGVFSQDDVVAIMDAWWTKGHTKDQDHALLAAEQNLFLSPVASG